MTIPNSNSTKHHVEDRLRAVLLFLFAKLLHAKPKHASGEAANRDKRGRKHEKKK